MLCKTKPKIYVHVVDVTVQKIVSDIYHQKIQVFFPHIMI